ncbi:MAG: DMT family transporter [Thermoleophilia bacterium]
MWGIITALGWGTADFIARFTGRSLGPRKALFGMFLSGAVVLTGVVALSGDLRIAGMGGGGSAAAAGGAAGSGVAGWFYVIAMGTGMTLGTLLLYWGLTRGPVTVVAPIVASYPAFNLLLAVAVGTRPSLAQWAATAAVMAGVVLVATSAAPDEAATEEHPGAHMRASKTHVRASAGIALLASLIFALVLEASQEAQLVFGDLPTVWLARLVGVAIMAVVLLLGRQKPSVPLRAWPLLTAQGLLDGGAYLTVLAGSKGEGAEITIVVSSTFAAVTVALARVVLREPIARGQWAGIALIMGGVAVLSGLG